jgi:ribosomal protein S18 acetylase RimI-like enzyme
MPPLDVTIRDAHARDLPRILEMAPRLHEFGPPPWRTVAEMDAGMVVRLTTVLANLPEDNAMYVADAGAAGGVVGFIHLVTFTDYFTNEPHGHVADIVVAKAGEGRGVGRALLDAAERWSTGHGYRLLTLHVFSENTHARAVYERVGYVPEYIRMTKVLA